MMRKTRPLRFLALAVAFVALLLSSKADAAAGDLYTQDETGGPIIRITPAGIRTAFAPGFGGSGMAFDRFGNLYVATSGSILKYTPDGKETTFVPQIGAAGLAFDRNGDLFAASGGSHAVFKITPDGTKSVFAAGLDNAVGVAFDSAGNLFVAQGGPGPILKFAPDGSRSVFAPDSTGAFGVAIDGAGYVYASDYLGGTIYKYPPDGASRTIFAPALGTSTTDTKFDSAGNLFVVAVGQKSIYKFAPNGARTIFASGLGFAAWAAFEPPRGFPLNFSTRLRIQTGENVMMGGFMVSGSDPTTVIIRAIGPSLSKFGVADSLQDPTLELHDQTGALIASNDNWKDTQLAAVQASGIPPSDDRESAIVITVPPGSYTAVVGGKDATMGVGLIEVYDLDRTTHSKLANISTRGFVETGDDVMIGGFIVGENGEKVIVRAIGPSLSSYGIMKPLPDPMLELHDGNGALLFSNDNWKDTQQIAIEATGIPPFSDLEAAIVTTLSPGDYTAIVQDKGGASGVAVVEVYNLP